MAWITTKIMRKAAAILIIDKNEWEELQLYKHQPKINSDIFWFDSKDFLKDRIATMIED